MKFTIKKFTESELEEQIISIRYSVIIKKDKVKILFSIVVDVNSPYS